MGYRVRPSWVWQRKRYGTSEVIVCIANDGVAGVPGVLRLSFESMDGKFRMSGGLDAGHPFGGRIRQASFVIPREIGAGSNCARKSKPGECAGRCDGHANNLSSRGAFLIELQAPDAPGWRKGV